MRTQIRLAVELDAGEKYTVVADQRDLAALEAQDGILNTNFTRARFLAWRAAKRTKRYTGTWEAWNDHDCAEVVSVDGDEAEAGDGLDPGPRNQSAGG